jgi:hypothetical protein
MSITSTVERRASTVAVVLLVAALVSVAAAPGVGARPRAPETGATDPVARAATLADMVNQRTAAVATATARRDSIKSRLVEAQRLEEAARARTDQLGQLEAEAALRYQRSRARVARFAAAAYRGGPSVTPLTQLLSSRTAADYAYRHEIVKRVGDMQHQLVLDAKRDRIAAATAAEEARTERDRLANLASSLERALPEREAALTTAVAAHDRAEFWWARWQAIAAGPATPIMGPTRLGADELSAWFVGTHHHADTTVPIEELTTYYIEEGAAVNVRADIAFAQSILETGGLSFPKGGQVLGTDNNFAGMGACDSCATGNRFVDARTGVRAQLQQLRVYADATLRNSMLNPPAVNPKLDQHHLKGKVPTWAGLTHTWATADTYGDRILAIYESILGWLTDRAKI